MLRNWMPEMSSNHNSCIWFQFMNLSMKQVFSYDFRMFPISYKAISIIRHLYNLLYLFIKENNYPTSYINKIYFNFYVKFNFYIDVNLATLNCANKHFKYS